jgi:hypothetical protein
MDAALKGRAAAQEFLATDPASLLRGRGVEASEFAGRRSVAAPRTE